jgi:hypothetical protein
MDIKGAREGHNANEKTSSQSNSLNPNNDRKTLAEGRQTKVRITKSHEQ